MEPDLNWKRLEANSPLPTPLQDEARHSGRQMVPYSILALGNANSFRAQRLRKEPIGMLAGSSTQLIVIAPSEIHAAVYLPQIAINEGVFVSQQINLSKKFATTKRSIWDVLESLAGSIDAPADWAEEHNHYLYGTPKHRRPAE